MATRRHKLSFVVHGQEGLNNRVLASVFATKLRDLIRGLRVADKVANGVAIHDYVIADLKVSSAAVSVDEVIASRKAPELGSAVVSFAECVGAITHSDFQKALRFGGTVDKVALLSRGAGEKFSHAELIVDDGEVFRVDEFLERQTELAKRLREDAQRAIGRFTGSAEGGFDGEIQEVDLRGARPRVKLILTAGGAQIDCILRGFTLEQIRAALKIRVWVEGEAVYSGETGLPVRLEISKITPIEPAADFRRWKGSFSPFEIEEWEDA